MFFETPQYEYKEILKLRDMLKASNIPFDIHPFFGGYHLRYPNKEHVICSVIEHNGSYGREEDLLEIMGLLTDKEAKGDSVLGYLSAKDVYNRILKHYNESL